VGVHGVFLVTLDVGQFKTYFKHNECEVFFSLQALTFYET
jgi:hypothetical protein